MGDQGGVLRRRVADAVAGVLDLLLSRGVAAVVRHQRGTGLRAGLPRAGRPAAAGAAERVPRGRRSERAKRN